MYLFLFSVMVLMLSPRIYMTTQTIVDLKTISATVWVHSLIDYCLKFCVLLQYEYVTTYILHLPSPFSQKAIMLPDDETLQFGIHRSWQPLNAPLLVHYYCSAPSWQCNQSNTPYLNGDPLSNSAALSSTNAV